MELFFQPASSACVFVCLFACLLVCGSLGVTTRTRVLKKSQNTEVIWRKKQNKSPPKTVCSRLFPGVRGQSCRSLKAADGGSTVCHPSQLHLQRPNEFLWPIRHLQSSSNSSLDEMRFAPIRQFSRDPTTEASDTPGASVGPNKEAPPFTSSTGHRSS